MTIFSYPPHVNLEETYKDKDGNDVPRYWGQKRSDGVLYDSVNSKSVSPLDQKPKIAIVPAGGGGVIARDLSEEARELRNITYGG